MLLKCFQSVYADIKKTLYQLSKQSSEVEKTKKLSRTKDDRSLNGDWRMNEWKALLCGPIQGISREFYTERANAFEDLMTRNRFSYKSL